MNYRSKYTGAEIEAALDKIINNVTDNDELATIIGNINKRFNNYLPTSGGTISASNVSPLMLNIKGSNAIYLTFSQNNEAKAYVGYNPSIGAFLQGPYGALTLNSEGASLYGNTLYHSGNFNPADYLPLSGGTITIGGPKEITIKRNASSAGAYLWFANNAGYLGAIGVSANKTLIFDNDTTVYDILHSGNYSDFALPLSGGILDGSLQIGKDDNTAYNGLRVIRSGKAVELTATNSTGVLLYNGVGFVFNETTASWNDNTLIHSGNIGSYAVITKDGIIVNDEYNIMGYGSIDGGWPKAGPAMAWGSWTGYRAFLHGRNGVLSFNTMENGTLTGWKTIAFTDSNVESAKYMATLFSDGSSWYRNMYRLYGQYDSVDGQTLELKTEGGYKVRTDIATKLATARTIWGQSFDGTGDVSGDLKNVTLIRFKDSGIYGIYRGVNYSEDLTTNDLAYVAINHSFYTSGYRSLFINEYGNVTIGDSDLAGTGAKLYVDGGVKVYEATNRRLYTKINSSSLQVGRTSSYTSGYKAGIAYGVDETAEGYIAGLYDITKSNTRYFFYGGDENNAPLIIRNDNVLIGTTTDDNSGAKLQISGDISMNGTSLTDKLTELEQRLTVLGG